MFKRNIWMELPFLLTLNANRISSIQPFSQVPMKPLLIFTPNISDIGFAVSLLGVRELLRFNLRNIKIIDLGKFGVGVTYQRLERFLGSGF